MIILAILSAVFFICAMAYWIRQANEQAKRDRRVFEPYPQSPASRDVQSLRQAALDAATLAEYKKRVDANESRSKGNRIECGEFLYDRETPALLRRQAQ